MHDLAAATGGAVIGNAGNVYGYNRSAWMNDVQVTQTRNYHRMQVMLSQVGMFRDDIRDLVSSSVTRQNNYVILMTLVLAFVADCYAEGPPSHQSVEYVRCCYYMCISGGLVFLVLAVLCAVGASNLAVICQRDMLTKQVRLPIDSMMEEIERLAGSEKVEAFENQSLRTIFRIPGIGRFKGQKRAKTTDATSDSGELSISEPEFSTAEAINSVRYTHLRAYYVKEREWRDLDKYGIIFGAAGLSNLLQAYGYFALSKVYEGKTCSSVVSQFMMILVDSILTMAFNKNMQIPCGMCLTEAVFALTAQVSCFVAVHSNRLRVDQVCIPLTFFCHAIVNIVGLRKLLQPSPEEAAAKQEETREKSRVVRFKEASRSSMDSFGSDESGSDSGGDTCRSAYRSARQPPARLVRQRTFIPEGKYLSRHRLLSSGSVVVCLAWTGCFIWSIVCNIRGNPDPGGKQAMLSLSAQDEYATFANTTHLRTKIVASTPATAKVNATPLFRRLSAEAAEFLDVVWPSPHFEPNAIACHAADSNDIHSRCVVAGKSFVYELKLGQGRAAELTQLDCTVTGAILDIVVRCPFEQALTACTHIVLTSSLLVRAVHVEDCAGSTVPHAVDVDGDGGGTAVRLKMAAAGDGTLLITEGQQILEHRLLALAGGSPEADFVRHRLWRPVWAVAEASWDDTFAFDATEVVFANTSVAAARTLGEAGHAGVERPLRLSKRQLLVLVSERGAVEVHDMEARRRCGAWALPALHGLRPLAVAWLTRAGSLLVLARADGSRGATARLARLQLPDFASSCGVPIAPTER